MDDLTLEQQRALALARARRAREQAGGSAASPPNPLFGSNPVLNTASDFMTGIGQGGTLAFGDEAAAGIGAAIKAPFTDKTLGEEYNDQLPKQRQIVSDAETRSPKTEMLGELTGGLLTMPLRMAASPVTAPATAAQALKLGRRAWELFKRSGKVAGTTAAYGAGYGAGKGEGMQDRGVNALAGGAVGGALGFASVPATEAAFKVGQKVVAPAYRAVFKPEAQATRNIGQMIGRDQEQAATMGQRIPERGLTDNEFDLYKSQGLPVLNIDRAGPIGLRTADASTVRSPIAAAALEPKLNKRAAGQYDLYEGVINDMLPQGGAEGARDAIIKQGRKINDVNYKLANLHPNSQQMWNEGFEQLAQSDIFQGAMKKALSAATDKSALGGGNAVRAPMSWIKQKDGTQRLMWNKDMGDIQPNLAFWDQVKRKLGDVIDDGTDSITGKKTSTALDAIQLKEQLVNHLDSMVPAYKTARVAAGRYLGEESASRLGEKLFTKGKGYSPERLEKVTSKWTDAEREEAAIGYLDALKTDLRKKAKEGDTGSYRDLSKVLFGGGSKADYDVARTILGKERAGRLEVLNRFNALANKSRGEIEGNSKTAKRIQADKLLSPWATTAGMGAAGYGADAGFTGDWNPLNEGAMTGVAAGLGKRGHDVMRERMAIEISKLLASADRKTLPAILGRIADDPRMMTWLRLAQHPLKVAAGQYGN